MGGVIPPSTYGGYMSSIPIVKKVYSCDICEKRFLNLSGRNGHMAWCRLKNPLRGIEVEKKTEVKEVKEKPKVGVLIGGYVL